MGLSEPATTIKTDLPGKSPPVDAESKNSASDVAETPAQ